MRRDYAGGEAPPPEEPPHVPGMWSPERQPHALLRELAEPMPCKGVCGGTYFGNGEGCTYCDYNPFETK